MNARITRASVTRSGALAPDLRIHVLPMAAYVGREGAHVRYTGTLANLAAAGIWTEELRAAKVAWRSGQELLDANGHRFWCHRAPTPRAPDRMQLVFFRTDNASVMALTGVRELFPEGLPVPQPREREIAAATDAAEWKRRQYDRLHAPIYLLDALPEAAERGAEFPFRWSVAEVERLRQFATKTASEFEALFASMTVNIRQNRPPAQEEEQVPPRRLRLVVDNTRRKA